ncbi:hypothetical protein I553_10718 [Mycobacterium xenopi 4042]|uniref:Uncharacterized protein n=1 Tax=Mycobacterium xenopi 4042 TaxID=1299334 RepID=X8DBI6_MYCXE|nr:hypothetical protein I553_10718 [Mycobacterium xenopi 4042]
MSSSLSGSSSAVAVMMRPRGIRHRLCGVVPALRRVTAIAPDDSIDGVGDHLRRFLQQHVPSPAICTKVAPPIPAARSRACDGGVNKSASPATTMHFAVMPARVEYWS